MIFGRKRKQADETPEDVNALAEAAPEDDDLVDEQPDAGSDESIDDQWSRLDASKDWREDGPFDLSEVDLDADDVERLDLGSLILTPFDDMQMQLQVEESTGEVHAALIMHANSAIEVSLFAAPSAHSMVPEIRQEMVTLSEAGGGEVELVEGPFGTEIRRVMPVTGPNGEELFHISRTWFAEGPKWLLRGVLMGEAGMQQGTDGAAELLFEFFQNIVVRRPDGPLVPGGIIPMELPANVVPAE